jgi:hypothetical protein
MRPWLTPRPHFFLENILHLPIPAAFHHKKGAVLTRITFLCGRRMIEENGPPLQGFGRAARGTLRDAQGWHGAGLWPREPNEIRPTVSVPPPNRRNGPCTDLLLFQPTRFPAFGFVSLPWRAWVKPRPNQSRTVCWNPIGHGSDSRRPFNPVQRRIWGSGGTEPSTLGDAQGWHGAGH